MRVHLTVNPYRPDALAAAGRAAAILRGRGASVAAETDAAARFKIDSVATESFADCDVAISFGGDGTLIRAASLCSTLGTPILGVYYGSFGFVTQCAPEELEANLIRIVEGHFKTAERMMLQVDLMRNDASIATIHALNEVAVQRSVTVRMLNFHVMVDGIELTTYPADGVILSTATGSTGYNLSAGGPLMDPRVHALILTALAPHTLSARPLVLPTSSEVHLSVESDGDAVLSGDGQSRLHLLSGDTVRIRKSPRVTRLVVVREDDFLRKLPQRLFWSQSALGNGS